MDSRRRLQFCGLQLAIVLIYTGHSSDVIVDSLLAMTIVTVIAGRRNASGFSINDENIPDQKPLALALNRQSADSPLTDIKDSFKTKFNYNSTPFKTCTEETNSDGRFIGNAHFPSPVLSTHTPCRSIHPPPWSEQRSVYFPNPSDDRGLLAQQLLFEVPRNNCSWDNSLGGDILLILNSLSHAWIWTACVDYSSANE
ncbi:hypothetical protein HNY73_003658 [Argiope bruennichi]|uniref:Uncharacterized protein n=1 Tax=Argiope bruennichi TaxID=94029 RepID=A0A8T0FM71_ARGBR|nr:hypothetical protein HNY73_003658 [Argiope bruennichi]